MNDSPAGDPYGNKRRSIGLEYAAYNSKESTFSDRKQKLLGIDPKNKIFSMRNPNVIKVPTASITQLNNRDLEGTGVISIQNTLTSGASRNDK
jgi:hypothetical protein